MKTKYVVLAALLATNINSAYAYSLATVALKNEGTNPIGQTLLDRKMFIITYTVDGYPTSKIQPQELVPFYVAKRNFAEGALGFSLTYYENGIPGGKKCTFETSNNMTTNPDGSHSYNWTKNAIGANGAICTATIHSTDATNGSWEIRFTMQ